MDPLKDIWHADFTIVGKVAISCIWGIWGLDADVLEKLVQHVKIPQ